MSGIVSGIGTIFEGAGTVAASSSLGTAVQGVGATSLAAAAATGAAGGAGAAAASAATSSVLNAGVLSSIISSASQLAQGATGTAVQSAVAPAAAAKAATAATTSALASGLQKTGSGLTQAATPTGMAPTGKSGGLLGDLMKSDMAGYLVLGASQGLGQYAAAQVAAEEADKQREWEAEQQQKITDSYDIDPSVLAGNGGADGSRAAGPSKVYPKPSEKYAKGYRYEYSPTAKTVIRVPN